MHRCIHQKISLTDTGTPQAVWPSVAVSSTNLAVHLVSVVSTNEQFLQSSSAVHYSLDHSAILRSNLDEDILLLSVVVAVVVELPERRSVVVQPAALVVVVKLIRERQEH